jgi:biotin carboxyl carrier protein
MMRLHLGRPALFAATLSLIVAFAATFYSGIRFGADWMMQEVHANNEGNQPFWQHEILTQRNLIAELGKNTETHLNALAVKLGEMRAQITRLDALGERLAGMAGFRKGEFDFSATPPVGGPAPGVHASSGLQDIVAAFDRLNTDIDDRSEKLTALESLLMNRNLQEKVHPAGTPLKDGWMSSGFGPRADPVTGHREYHQGIDFTGAAGSKVVAMAAGIVTWSGWRDEFGNVVEINHGNGYITRYAHNKKMLVQVGDKVDKGQAVAIMGATGRTTGAHVHFEVLKDGNLVDPVKYLPSAKDKQADG